MPISKIIPSSQSVSTVISAMTLLWIGISSLFFFRCEPGNNCSDVNADSGWGCDTESSPDGSLDGTGDSDADVKGDTETDLDHDPVAPDGGEDISDGGDEDAADGSNPLHLRPMTEIEVTALAEFTRRTIVVGYNGQSTPVAWSNITSDCNNRMKLVQYVFSTVKTPLDSALAVRTSDMTTEKIEAILLHPANDIGGIYIYGSVRVTQELRYYNGSPASAQKMDYSWASHYISLVNVAGTYMVVDLSIGDAPVTIGDWFTGLAGDIANCPFGGVFETIAEFQNAVQNSEPGENSPCVHYYIKPFWSHIGGGTEVVPEDLKAAALYFMEMLFGDFLIPDPQLIEIPYFLTGYSPRP